MRKMIVDFARRLTGVPELLCELQQARTALDQLREVVMRYPLTQFDCGLAALRRSSIDAAPWRHPFLTAEKIRAFRSYSEAVWEVARRYEEREARRPLRCAFAVNMAQNMYKWSRLAEKYGAHAALFLNPMDSSALSRPEWEEFDGEFADLMDGAEFLRRHPHIPLAVPCHAEPLNGDDLSMGYVEFCMGGQKNLLRLLAANPALRHETFLAHNGLYPYFSWARKLARFEVIYAASTALPAYVSGKPYCMFAVGGDLQFDCGRNDDYGRTELLGFNAARFLMVSNPHALGHSRRLGLTNGVYLPYPMDDSRYCPGEGNARREWEARFGTGVYVLSASRLDSRVKGQHQTFLEALVAVARQRPCLRFVFLCWGNDAADFQDRIRALGASDQFIVLSPVGKKRLIDYYRSCDIVIDHFVYGYYGATTLEAAAIGKPVIMKLRDEHYRPLYAGDVAPVENAESPAEVANALLALLDNAEYRSQKGAAMREWLVRNHGEATTVPLMLSLLRLAADEVPLPRDLVSPLLAEESEEERLYHCQCLTEPK